MTSKVEYKYEIDCDEKGLVIPRTFEMEENNERIAFWRPPGWAGQWVYTPFELDGITFTCAEQAMMYKKAMLSNDINTGVLILNANHPKLYKSLGRKVKNFNQEDWDKNKLEIVKKVNMAKFSQNPLFKEVLLKTGSKLLIEASPFDKIWGIGVDPKTAMKLRESEFRGENLLGKALMMVRDELKNI